MKVDLDELEASLEGLKNLLVEHSKRSPGFLTVTDITTGEQLDCIEPLLIGRYAEEDEAFTEAVAAACANIFALIAELRELRAGEARAVEALKEIAVFAQGLRERTNTPTFVIIGHMIEGYLNKHAARAAALRAGEEQ